MCQLVVNAKLPHAYKSEVYVTVKNTENIFAYARVASAFEKLLINKFISYFLLFSRTVLLYLRYFFKVTAKMVAMVGIR